MEILLLYLIIGGILIIIVLQRSRKVKYKTEANPKVEIEDKAFMPFAKRDDFLTNAEFSFYKVLRNVVKDEYIICPKVALGDIFFVTKTYNESKMAHHNKINRKHIDFLICDCKRMNPILGIELDDNSHNKSNRIERDIFVDQLFNVANIPLIRFKAEHSYVPSELNNKFQEVLSNITISSKAAITLDNNTTIKCPKCGIPMVKKKAKKGKFAGKEFYGCSNYPKCKEIINITNES